MKLSQYEDAHPEKWQNKIATIRIYTLDVDVKVLEIDKQRSHSRALVSPVAGSGQRWIAIESLNTPRTLYPVNMIFDISVLSPIL